MRIPSILIALGFGMAGVVGHAESASDLGVIHHYTLGGEGGWDYLTFDEPARRIFVTRGDHVMVVAADSGKLVGDITGVKRSHGVALVPSLRRGYISNGQGGSVTAFDLDSLKVIGEFPVTGKNPDAILFDSASRRVFTFNGGSNNVSAIDPATGKVVATIEAPGRPEFAVSDGAGHLFFNVEDKSLIAEIDAAAATITHTWSLAPCEEPTGLAIDVARKRLFSVCANRQMAVLDAGDGHIVASVPIGDGPDAAAYDAAKATVYSSNSDGTLTVVHQDDADHYHVVANVATPKRSRTLALDPKTHDIFLATAEFGETPAPTADVPRPRPPMKPESFSLVVVGQR